VSALHYGYVRRAGVIAFAGMLGGCPSVDPYACAVDTQCRLGGEQGICADERCAYEDAECPSGFRYPEQTDLGLAGVCVPNEGDTDTLITTSSSSSESTDAPLTETTSEASSSSTSGTPACELEPSPPIAFQGEKNLVVERLTIEASATAALRITDCPGAIIRDLEIHFAGNPGIVIENSPGAVVERVALVNAAAPKTGPAALPEIGIHVESSHGIEIRDVTVDDPRSGIQVLGSDDALLEDFRVHNARSEDQTGNDSGGDCVLLQSGSNAIVQRFACTNDPTGVNAHAGIFVDRAPGTRVANGLATNVISASDAGVRVHTQDGTGGVVVESVDVVGGTHACFDIVWGDDVTLIDTGCRNNEGHGWSVTQMIGEVRVQMGRYYNLGEGELCCGEMLTEFDVAPDQFVPRLPPDVAPPCSGV
jgi:hypothetical protein